MRSLLTNPEALQAIMQIQQGMQRLQSSAPLDLLSGLGFPAFPGATQSQTTSNTTQSSEQQQQNNRPPQPNLNSLFNTPSSNYFSQMLNMMANNTIVNK